MKSGKVYFVGAGVGQGALLTLRAQELLVQAEVVLADALLDRYLQQFISPTCTWIEVGKRGGQESVSQATINQLLVAQCRQGKRIVRLKSGDPWVFGRALQELEALQEAGIPWEVVPGVSSALAAPLFAGIPLTETDRGNCFVVATGHDVDALPWAALAQIPTLVFLMGTRHLCAICTRLGQYRSPDTPVAVIYRCGSPHQQVWTGTLAHRDIPSIDLSPSVIVIGESIHHRSWLGEQVPETLPLQGRRILVTRSVGQAGDFTEGLQALGAATIEMPALDILPPSSWEPLDGAIATLTEYDWLILTSTNGVTSFFQRLHHGGKDSRALHGLQIAVVGKKTAEALQSYGIVPDLIPPQFIADSLIDVFPSPLGKRILFPRVESGGREVLISQLQSQGAIVAALPAYESGCPATIPDVALQAIQHQTIDVITFASSKTVHHFAQLLSRSSPSETPQIWREWIAPAKIASIGTQTSQACCEVLGKVDIEAKEFTLPGLTAAIVAYFVSNP